MSCRGLRRFRKESKFLPDGLVLTWSAKPPIWNKRSWGLKTSLQDDRPSEQWCMARLRKIHAVEVSRRFPAFTVMGHYRVYSNRRRLQRSIDIHPSHNVTLKQIDQQISLHFAIYDVFSLDINNCSAENRSHLDIPICFPKVWLTAASRYTQQTDIFPKPYRQTKSWQTSYEL